MDKLKGSQTDTKKQGYKQIEMYRETDKYGTDTQTDEEMVRQTHRHADKQKMHLN